MKEVQCQPCFRFAPEPLSGLSIAKLKNQIYADQMRLFLFLLFFSSLSIAQTQCPICCEQDACNSPSCEACLLRYLEEKLRAGQLEIKLINCRKIFHSDLTDFDFYSIESIRTYFEQLNRMDLLDLLSETMARDLHFKNFDMPCPNCGTFFVNPTGDKRWKPSGKCISCKKKYKKSSIGLVQGGRHCPYCKAIMVKADGCDRMICGGCNRAFKWENAEETEKDVTCSCW